MNEKALEYSYSLFSQDGYNGSIEDYKNLISTNEDALNYSYNLFSSDGYNGSQDDFFNLISLPDPVVDIEDKDEEVILEPKIAKVPEEIIERNKRWDKGEFLMEEREAFEEYNKPENKEKRKNLEANEIFSNLETSLKNIPQEKITEETAKNYFKLDQRPVSIVTDPNVEPDFYENLTFKEYREKGLREGFLTEEEAKFYIGSGSKRVGKKYQPIDQYLSPEKLEEYNNYQQTGVLEALNANDEAEIKAAKNQSLNNLYKKETQLFLNNVPEKIKDLMGPFGTDKKYKNVEDAAKSLNLGREILIENNNKLKEDYNSYIEQAKPYQEGINNVIEKINNIEKNIPSGNVKDGTDTQIKEYQILLAEAEKLQDEYEQKGLNTIYDNLAKQQKLNELNLDKFNNETRDVQTKAIIEKQLGLDYSLSARTGMALEEFFVGGLLNLGSLTSQLLLKGGKLLANPANSDIIDNITESIVQTTRDYNSKLAEKRETTIPDNITLDDIESENVNFFDWFGGALANNSPSIITTFVPGTAALRGASIVRGAATKKLSQQAAKQAQKRLMTAGTRTAQGIFFVGEGGSRYGDLELQQGRALENLPKLKKQIEEELDPAKKMQMQEDYEDLERISDYSFAQKAFTSYLYAGAATLAETLGSLRIINGAGKLASKMGKQQFKAEAYASPLNFAANTTGKAISGISKNAGKAIAIEEAEETLTQVAHNLIDILALKENKSIIEGIDKEFLANTAVTSFAIMAPKTMGNTRNMLKNEFTTREEILNNQDDVIELIQLQEQFKALESGPEKTALRKRRRELLNKLAIADGMTLTKLNSMTNEEVVEAADLARQMRQLKNQMFELGRTGELSEGGRKARKQIEDQYNSVNKRREDLLNKRLKEDRSKIKELREELGENFVNLNAEYYFGLYDFYKNVAMTLMPKDGKFIVVDTKNKNWRDDLTDLSKEELAQVEAFVETGNNGVAIGNNILINENVVTTQIGVSGILTEAGYAAAAPIEELFHIQNKAKNIVDKDGMLSEEATKAVDQAIEVIKNKFELGKISEQDYNGLIARFNLYKTGGKGKVVLKSGKRGKATADAEEIMAQINNAVAIGALSLEDIETMPSLKDFINGISKDIFGDSSWMFDLKTANDVFNFIKNYQSNIQEGVKLALPDDEDDIEKASKTIDLTKQSNQDKLNDLVGSTNEQGFYTVSKDEFTGSQAETVAKQLVDNGAFDNLIGAKIKVTDTKQRQDILEDSKEEIKLHIERFNPSLNKSLFGYINTYIGAKVGTVAKKALKAPKTIATDKKIGGEESRTTVGETLVSDEISPEDYTDMQLAKEKLDKIEPQQSAIANKIGLTDNEINLAKRDIIGFLRKTDRPDMTDPKKFFKALVDYTTGKGVQPGGFAKVIYDKLSLLKDGKLSTKNKEAFIREIAKDLIALNKVDPAVMRRSKWTPFYELEIKRMNTKQTQKAIDEGRIPSTTNLEAGNDLFKTLDPSVNEVVEYLNNIRPDVLKRKMPKFLGEVIVKNEFNEIVDNPKQPVYDAKGNETDNTIDLSESITEEEVTRGAPQVREKIARPEGVKFNKAVKEIINIRDLFQLEANGKDKLLKAYKLKDSLKIKNEDDIKVYTDMLKTDIFKLGPKEMWFGPGKGTAFTSSSKNLGMSSKDPLWSKFKEEVQKLKNDNTIKYGKSIRGVNNKDIWSLRNKYDKLFKSPEIIKENIKSGEIKKFNKQVAAIHKALWKRINKEISKNKNKAVGIATYLGITANDTGHWHKLGAQFEGYSKDITGKRYEYEHAMPATAAYLYLLDATLSDVDFNAAYDLVINNYKLIALDKAMDDKLRNARTAKGYSLQRRMPDDWSVIDNSWWQRYFNDIVSSQNGGIDPNSIIGLNGNTFSKMFSVDASGNSTVVKVQKLKKFSKSANIKDLSNNVVKFNKNITNEGVIGYAKTVDEALKVARDPNALIKKIRVFDFDDTLATTKSDVLFTAPNGTEGSLTAEKFAMDGARLLEEGYVFDFSEFNKVTKGKPGPLLDIAKKIQAVRGTEDVFVLTARAPEAQVAIKEFLDSVGLNIPLENITGLGNSTGEAKANWMVEKAAEGYNDFYFADDALQNVEAVRKSMDMLDVKSKTQLVRKNEIKFSKTSSKKLNFKTDEAGNIKANFTINNKKYNINLDSRDNKGSFDLEFDLDGRIDITGTGDAVKVVRTVYNGLLDAIDQNKNIKRIEFSSLKSELSRVRLYTTLMNSVAKKLGWNTDVWESNNFIAPEKSSYDFEITKPRKKQVAPVEKVLDVVDVKSEVQQDKIKFSKSVNEDFNKIIEQTTGIASEKVYSEAKAKVRGANKGNKKFFIPYSAEDFMGLIYPLLSKGKLGDSQMAWFKQNLLDPYARAQENISADRLQLMEDFKALKKALEVPKDLRKKTDSGFTKEQAVRVYLFNKAGFEVPGISKTDLNELLDLVNSDGVLKVFADQIFSITKGDSYAKPGENWLVGTITTDLIDVLNTVKRAKYLEQSGYTANVELIFSKENLNKLEAAYGTKYREAMENILSRMKSGKNRIFSGNRLSNRVLDYINNSTGAIMFFNTRSAVLQTISSINFLNWSFNNPIKAGAAFANQKQYWKDFVELINSDYLVDRRNGLKLNINESEIADAAATSKNKAKAAINYILQKGFLPTQFADSFAIASGGATFYRNRINDLIENQGMSESDAKKQAMLEWRETAEVSQQSSDPSKISAQQASDLGRVILAFANTPMQYARIQKRAVQDLINGRGDAKTHVSKIIYYAVVQNLIFNALQSALFGLGFGDDEDDEKKEKMYLRTANGMLDSQLRGLGLAGATVAVIKNFLTDIYERSGRKRPEYVDSIYKLLQISPPISSKISKIRGAAYQFDSKKRREEIFKKGFNIDNPAYEAFAKVISATANIPLDRVYSKIDNISGAMSEDAETWQTIAMLAGWPKWQIMSKEKEVSTFNKGNVKISSRRKFKRKSFKR
jgi:hypothetical protein